MKKKKIIVLAKGVELKKVAEMAACCKAGPRRMLTEEE